MIGWSVLALLAFGAIGFAAWLFGRTPPKHPDTLVQSLAAAGHTPAVALALACAGLLHAVWCVRHLILHKLAWNAGPIEVRTFTEDTPLTNASAEQLTVDFRQRLMRLHLQAPTPVPGAAPQGRMLDVLENSSPEINNPFSFLVALLRAAIPSHAYEVQGSLRQRGTAPCFGVTVQVISLTAESLPPETFWGHSWEEALSRAADEATAAILPQTRRCSAPWGVWRGYVMPQGLLHEYESGARLEHDRRYDEALAAYWRAVELDPMNMVLRLRVGLLQERLGLYLDALATLWGMEVTSQPNGRRKTPRGRRERNKALVSARYRRNVLLGGRVLATQWCAPNQEAGSKLRDAERKRLRNCLRPRLVEALGVPPGDKALKEPSRRWDEKQFLALRALLARHALDDCAKLRRKFLRGRLSRATLRLTELCIDVRLDWVKHRITSPELPWPEPPVGAAIKKIERWHRLAFREWHEQYNAACAWALVLADDGIRMSPRAREVAGCAVERLERATARADSAYIASRRDWVVSEDPDLAALRARHEFKEFQLLYLPADGLTPGRPQNVLQIESSRYVRDLLVAVAGRWQATWRERHAEAIAEVDPRHMREWFESERRIWGRLHEVTVNFRHPKTRASLIKEQRVCSAAVDACFPKYEREPLPEQALERTATQTVKDANARFHELELMLDPLLGELDRWLQVVRERSAAGRPVSPHVLRRRCTLHGALWQRLGEWLLESGGDPAKGRDAMQAAATSLRLAPDHPLNGRGSASQLDGPDRDLARFARTHHAQ